MGSILENLQAKFFKVRGKSDWILLVNFTASIGSMPAFWNWQFLIPENPLSLEQIAGNSHEVSSTDYFMLGRNHG